MQGEISENHFLPFVYQSFYIPCCIGRTCGGEADGGSAGGAFHIFFIITECGFAVCTDDPDVGCGKDRGEVIDRDISNAGVGRTRDITGMDHIPDCDPVTEQERLLFFDRLRHLLLKK